MLLELSKIAGLSVGSFDEGALVGKIVKPVISYKEKKVLGFVVKPSGFLAQNKVISIEDVIDIDQSGLVVRSAESLIDLGEVVRMSEIIKSKFKLIGLGVESKEGKYLGNVYDALVDSSSGEIIRIYVRQFLSDYVFDHSQIEEITLKMVKLRTEKRQRAKKTIESFSQAKA